MRVSIHTSVNVCSYRYATRTTMVRRTKEEAQATRNHILDTAEMVFQQHGVSRTTLQQIAAAAGVTRGAIYWHFRDKAELFNAMMERVTLPLEQDVKASDDPMLDEPLEHVRQSFTAALRKTVDDPQGRICGRTAGSARSAPRHAQRLPRPRGARPEAGRAARPGHAEDSRAVGGAGPARAHRRVDPELDARPGGFRSGE